MPSAIAGVHFRLSCVARIDHENASVAGRLRFFTSTNASIGPPDTPGRAALTAELDIISENQPIGQIGGSAWKEAFVRRGVQHTRGLQ